MPTLGVSNQRLCAGTRNYNYGWLFHLRNYNFIHFYCSPANWRGNLLVDLTSVKRILQKDLQGTNLQGTNTLALTADFLLKFKNSPIFECLVCTRNRARQFYTNLPYLISLIMQQYPVFVPILPGGSWASVKLKGLFNFTHLLVLTLGFQSKPPWLPTPFHCAVLRMNYL